MLSTFPTLLPFMLFAFVASITPGPTNILVLSNSARYGFRATLPFIAGAGASAASIVFMVGCGLGNGLSQVPWLQVAMKWLGVAWLSHLALKIYLTPPDLEITDVRNNGSVAGLWTAISLQWVNPKTWMMAFAVITVFNERGVNRQEHIGWMSLVFFLVALPCLSAWGILGAGSRQSLRSPRLRNNFYRGLGLLLLLSTWLGLWW